MASPTPIPITSPATGFASFSMPHGLPAAPWQMPQITMTSDGSIWFDATLPYDAENFYLHASDANLTAIALAYAGSPTGNMYTSVVLVSQMFPTFKRGIPSQNPADSLITQIIGYIGWKINAVRQRRFGEAISDAGGFAAWQASLSTDALNLLEIINRQGAAAQLGSVFESLGNAAAARVAKDHQDRFREDFLELNGWDQNEKPKPQGGAYDHLFDELARTETPRPILQGVAGGDQPDDIAPGDLGQSNVFGKFDKRGT